MSQKRFIQVVGLLFGLKAVFGLIYIFWGWNISISGWTMPVWLIVVAVVVDTYLAYLAAKFTKIIK